MIDQLKKQLGSEHFTPKRITALLIFGAIILVFVLFGFQGKHTATGVGAAARVNSKLISVADLQAENARMEQIYGQMFGGQMSGEAQRQFLRGQALENLITNELISQAAKSQGILVTDAEVRDYVLTQMPVFQKDGRFQRDAYVQILAANHLAPADFEDKIRSERKNSRARELFAEASGPLNFEIEKSISLKSSKINVAFAKVDEDKLQESLPVAKSEIDQKLAQPEFMKKVQTEFTANKPNYSSEEQVKVSHILIKTNPNDPASEKAALEKINSLKKRSEKEDFGKLAAEASEDLGSKSNKGQLGFFGHGKMVPEFENAAFSQSVGVVGAPVKTTYGYHIIKVTDKKSATVGTLENSQEKIARKLIAEEKITASAKALEAALQKKDSAEVDRILKSLGVNWDETGFFDLAADIIPKLESAQISHAAFEVNEENPLLPRLVREGGQTYVIKFKSSKSEAPSVEDKKWSANITRERSNELFALWIDQAKKAATIEKNPQVNPQD